MPKYNVKALIINFAIGNKDDVFVSDIFLISIIYIWIRMRDKNILVWYGRDYMYGIWKLLA